MGLDEDDTFDVAEVPLGLRLRYHTHTHARTLRKIDVILKETTPQNFPRKCESGQGEIARPEEKNITKLLDEKTTNGKTEDGRG